jgi:ABC-type cobalamin/Fe3+-siderophores transport system ATPase subunit
MCGKSELLDAINDMLHVRIGNVGLHDNDHMAGLFVLSP